MALVLLDKVLEDAYVVAVYSGRCVACSFRAQNRVHNARLLLGCLSACIVG